jgi:bifunctional isochorismate lyase/aryl carrier protein
MNQAEALTRIRSEVAELLEVAPEEIGDDDSLLDWGLDSLRVMTLVERWRSEGVEVSFVALAEEPTLRGFARLVAAE